MLSWSTLCQLYLSATPGQCGKADFDVRRFRPKNSDNNRGEISVALLDGVIVSAVTVFVECSNGKVNFACDCI